MKPALLLLLGAAAASVSSAATLTKDIVYGFAGGARLTLDACVPDGPGPFPVAILVHGGGWSSGDKSGGKGSADISPWFGMLTKADFTWFSIDYRLAPAHRWPACRDDLATAVLWVKAHAAEYKGDPSRIALVGHSAGGHLVCLYGVTARGAARVQAIVAFAPVTDLVADSVRRGGLSTSLQNLFGLPRELTRRSRAILAAASPIAHVAPGDPPFLLVQGKADRTVPYPQTLAFKARLDAAGVPCRLIAIPGGPHAFTGWSRLDPSYQGEVADWLRAKLGGAGAGSACSPR